MITRNRARTALAELPQVQVHSAAFVDPKQSPVKLPKKSSLSAASEKQSAGGVAILAKKMNVISLDSSSEDDVAPNSERDAIDLSESSQSVIGLSSSDDDDDSDISDDEDGDESEHSDYEDRGQKKPSSSTPASKLLVEEVAKLIRGGDLKNLKVDDCKTYLRCFGLLMSGTKSVLIDRIKQHIELQQGGSRKYDRSTFTENCTGDVCKGDVVIFHQKVKKASEKGRRTVAGRVVSESYGLQRQQHTFTVEVLWSTGCCRLAPMKPLLVKGRNLYKGRTLRQKWPDERERLRILDEKHERGAAARQVRAMKHGRLKGHRGPSSKQLANPFSDTLASKENRNYSRGKVIQSAASVPQFAAVRTQHHAVHHHTSTGANAVPLGKMRQFGLPIEDGEIKEAPGDAETSANQHRQWFKPLRLPADREARNVSSSSQWPGGSSGSQSGPRNPRQSRSVQAPITSASSLERPVSPFPNRPSSSLLGRPVSPFPNRPSSPSLGRPVSPFPNRPSSSLLGRPVSPFPNRPSSPLLDRPMSAFPNRPPSLSLGRPVSPFPSRPPFLDRPVSPFPNRPPSPFLGRPESPFPNRPSSPFLSRPVSAFPNRPSSPFLSRPVSAFPNRPSPILSRPESPFPNRPSPILSRPVSPFPNRPSSPILSRPVSPFPNRPPSPFRNGPFVRDGLLGSAPSNPSPGRSGYRSRQGPQNGFICPTKMCTNRGSSSCSSGLCYYCCQIKGGACRNPRHRS